MHNIHVNDLNDKQRGVVTSIRHLDSTNAFHGESLLRTFADMFPPADLFLKELCELPAIYTGLRNFLDSHGANMQQHASRRIMTTLAHNIYEEQEDKQAAIDIVSEIMAAGRRMRTDISRTDKNRQQESRAGSASTSGSSAPDKLAHKRRHAS